MILLLETIYICDFAVEVGLGWLFGYDYSEEYFGGILFSERNYYGRRLGVTRKRI